MNAYGDSQPPRGRAQVHAAYGEPEHGGGAYGEQEHGDGYGYEHDSYAENSYGADPYPADSYGPDPYAADSYADAYGPVAGHPPAPASPQVGRAAVGSAAVGGAAVGAASVGRASVGRASVAAPPAPEPVVPRYDWGHASPAGAGRTSVPVSPGGAGAVGRATVRPTAPGGAGPGGTRPGGPGTGGPGRRPARKKQKHWMRNALLCSVALVVMSAGGGMVALSMYVDNVVPPSQVALPEGTTFHYASGRQFAKLADQNRQIIDTTVEELTIVRDAVVAAEDTKFYEHDGVDFAGIMRAAWNNFTGGETQGASTITQQYARAAANSYEASYGRKIREAAMAYKLDKQYSKAEILDLYLNTVYFGRGGYGVEAGANAYFRKDAAELTVAEAAVLAAVIKQPEADAITGHPGFDPVKAPDEAQARWNYVLDQMVEMGNLDPAERATMEYPGVKETGGCVDDCGVKTPQGNVINYVREELAEMGITDLRTGGYRITTSIDRDLQKAAVDAVRRKSDGSLLQGQPENLMAALVAIDPESGRVLAYYGGDDGTGFDYAGRNWDEDKGAWVGGRPPGSSNKIYTLIAAQRAGISFNTRWDSSDFNLPGTDIRVQNAGRRPACGKFCTLTESTVQSYNVPYAHISIALGPQEIVRAARDAGVTMMWDDGGTAYDLTETEPEDTPFWHPVAYGQYAITVLDHATGVATLAARGVYHQPHFVVKVEQKNAQTGEWETVAGDQISGEQRIEQSIADSMTQVLTQVSANDFALNNGRPGAAKTGTWEHLTAEEYIDGNADAWTVGYTPQIAAAVWVGNKKDVKPIRDQFGSDIYGAGLPGQMWKRFMDAAHEVKEWPVEQFPPAPFVGSDQHPAANGQTPAPRPGRGRGGDNCILPPVLCDNDDDDDNDNGGGGGGTDDSGGVFPLPPVLPPPPPPTGEP